MKIKKVKFYKEFKRGLPNYSNITVGMGLEFEVEEGNEANFDEVWEIINQQLTIQSDGTEQSWMRGKELKDSYKLTIKTKKKEGGEK